MKQLRDAARPDGRNATVDSPISADGRGVAGQRYRIPPREGRAIRLKAGETLTIENTHGTQVCDFWAFDAADIQLFLSLEHTRPYINRVIPQAGDMLVDNEREPLSNSSLTPRLACMTRSSRPATMRAT